MDRSDLFSRVVRNPWKVIVAWLLVAGGLGYFAQFLAPSISMTDLLGPGYPGLADFNFVQSEYTKDDNALVMIEAKDGDPFTREILAGVQELAAHLWEAPYSTRVDAVTNFQHSSAIDDDLSVGDLVVNPSELTPDEIANIRTIATTDPLAVNRVTDPEGRVLAVNVLFDFPLLDMNEKLDADAFVQEAAEAFRVQFPQTNVYVGGLTPLDATVMSISMAESALFLGLSLLIVLVLLSVLWRTIRAVLFPHLSPEHSGCDVVGRNVGLEAHAVHLIGTHDRARDRRGRLRAPGHRLPKSAARGSGAEAGARDGAARERPGDPGDERHDGRRVPDAQLQRIDLDRRPGHTIGLRCRVRGSADADPAARAAHGRQSQGEARSGGGHDGALQPTRRSPVRQPHSGSGGQCHGRGGAGCSGVPK